MLSVKAPLYYIVLYSSLWAVFSKIVSFQQKKRKKKWKFTGVIRTSSIQRPGIEEIVLESAEFKKDEKSELYVEQKVSSWGKCESYQSVSIQSIDNLSIDLQLLQAVSLMLVFLLFFVIIFIVVPRVYLGSGTYAGQVMISLFDTNLALGAIIIPLFSIYQLRKKRDLPFTVSCQ